MDRIKYLLLAFLREAITPAEQAELDTWLAEDPSHASLLSDMQVPARVAEGLAKLDQLHRQEAWARVESYASAHRPAVLTLDDRSASRRRFLRWSSAAAAVLIIAATGILLPWARRNHSPAVATTAVSVHDVQPGTNKAVLTLSGGRQVLLDSATEDTVLTEGAAIVAGAKGKLAYNPGNQADAAVVYNTLTTPRGGTYQLTLPDGTQVWLNAASSITYPTSFTGDERDVTITGEAYFEVAKNAAQPFIVNITGREQVTVLGTAFNINAYPDEYAIKTTLLEGSVRVRRDSSRSQGLTLLPGNQAVLPIGDNSAGSPLFIATNADLAQVMAWKNGLFAFRDADVQTVMRQLSRWYNVNVKYEGNIPKDKFQFNGKIGKMLTLDQVLKILTKTQVHYTIDGNELTIRP